MAPDGQRPLRRRMRFMIALACCIAAACSTEPDFLPNTAVILYGTVADAAGAPISGARVTASYHRPLCSVAPSATDVTTTGADGRYRMLFQVSNFFDGCVRFVFEAAGFQTLSTTRLDIQFRETRPDSVATNATLNRP